MFSLVVLVVAFPTSGAGAIKIKWVTSIYADASGVGLKYPEGVACGSDFIVVADTGNNRLVRYTYRDESVIPDAEFSVPRSVPIIVQLNAKGDVYFLDGRERRIVKIGATGEEEGPVKPKSVPSSKEIIPKSFRIDDRGNIYILDIFSAQVLVLDADEQYLRRIPFPERFGFFSDLEIGGQGQVFLLDSVEAVVYSAAEDSKTFSPMTASLKDVMNFPVRMTIDDQGILYLVDQNGSGLGIIGQDGSFLGRKLGLGWNQSGLYYPSQSCISGNGSVFIADRNNSRVQMFMIDRD